MPRRRPAEGGSPLPTLTVTADAEVVEKLVTAAAAVLSSAPDLRHPAAIDAVVTLQSDTHVLLTALAGRVANRHRFPA